MVTLWAEVEIAMMRVNRQQASEAMLTQMAVNSVLSKEGSTNFSKQIRKMTDG